MPAYVVAFDPSVNVPSRNGVKAAVVFANNATDARAILKAQYADDVDSSWDNATVTQIAAGVDLVGYVYRAEIITPEGISLVAVEVTGDVTNNTIDEIAALLVTALNADSHIAGAAYNAGTNTLTAAQTTDNLGDHRLVVSAFPPGENRVALPGLIGAVTQSGAANAALTVVFSADAYSLPATTARFASRE